jgi:hypothetical protein
MADAGTLIEDRPTVVVPQRSPLHIAIAAGLGVFATLVGLIVLAWAVLFITKGRFLKHAFEHLASRYTGREVKVAGDFNLYLNPINTAFLAEGRPSGIRIGRPSLISSRPIASTARSRRYCWSSAIAASTGST